MEPEESLRDEIRRINQARQAQDRDKAKAKKDCQEWISKYQHEFDVVDQKCRELAAVAKLVSQKLTESGLPPEVTIYRAVMKGGVIRDRRAVTTKHVLADGWTLNQWKAYEESVVEDTGDRSRRVSTFSHPPRGRALLCDGRLAHYWLQDDGTACAVADNAQNSWAIDLDESRHFHLIPDDRDTAYVPHGLYEEYKKWATCARDSGLRMPPYENVSATLTLPRKLALLRAELANLALQTGVAE